MELKVSLFDMDELVSAFLFQKAVTAEFVVGMSILEKLVLGIGLGFFGLMTFYVLFFKTSTLNLFPRVFLRLTLLLGVLASFTTSYFILSEFLARQAPQSQEAISSPAVSSPQIGGDDRIREIHRDRRMKLDQALEP